MNFHELQSRGLNPLFLKEQAKAITEEIRKSEKSETGFFDEDYIRQKATAIIAYLDTAVQQ